MGYCLIVIYYITGEGIDYESGPYNVTFSPGDTSATFDILISHDHIEEDIESFMISISPHLPPLVTHGNIIQATVIIINKNVECKFIQILLNYNYVV